MSGIGAPHGSGAIPDVVTDRIFLRTHTDSSQGQIVHGWSGSWPPPDRLVRIQKKNEPRETRVCEPSAQSPGALEKFEQHPAFIVSYYRLNSASEVDHPASPDEMWFRGAEYLMET